MKISFLRVFPLVLALIFSSSSSGLAQPSENIPVDTESMDRGEYITKHVAMCVQCHSPRNDKGVINENLLFHGAPMPAGAPWFVDDWAYQAPNIRGFLGYTDEEAVEFLRSGAIRPNGTRPRLPMPPFRMSKEDAEAVVKYLKSLS